MPISQHMNLGGDSRKRVLVVDDDPDFRAVVSAVLETRGDIVVEQAESAEAAVSRVTVARLDLVLTDLVLPGADGFYLLVEAKRTDATLPVVVMTGGSEGEASIEALRRGADDFLRKPIHADELLRVCHLALEKGQLLRENQHQRERLERLYKVQSEFLASMSHELRTPLTTIIGMSEVLQDGMFGELNPKQSGYMRTLHQSALHLLGLINDILDFSKIDAGKMTLRRETMLAEEAIRGACALVAGLIQERGVHIEVVPAPITGDEPLRLLADRGKVVQILVNLLSNAVKFSPPGRSVRVWAAAAGPRMRFVVQDRGSGIAPESQKAIFEAFQQVHRGASGKDPGTGLGLAVSLRLAELHGGTIRVESVLGAGSTFTVDLPRLAAEEFTDQPEAPLALAAVSN